MPNDSLLKSQWLQMLAQDKATPFTDMQLVKVGILLPHEIFSSLWNYGGGELFSALFAGTPSDACQHAAHVSMHVDVQDLCQYWDHNPDLEQAIREYWAEQGVEPVDEVRASCVPLRLYGDGAEVMSAGLRHFVW